jgi:hypothetical protein
MAVEEQFILRVPLDIAEQLNQLLSKQTASADLPIDLAFSGETVHLLPRAIANSHRCSVSRFNWCF